MTQLSAHITQEIGEGELTFLRLQNAHGMARVCLLGATVTEYQPAGGQPVLWTSPQSQYSIGTPIRGGIPVCWPWFGQHATPGFPAHGFVRSLLWKVLRFEEFGEERSQVVLGIEDN